MKVERPTRDSVAGRAYLDLRRKARVDGRLTDEYLRLYVLEGFLARMAASAYAETLVVKGGVLLAAYAIRRPTADIDVAAQHISGELDQVRDVVSAIAAQPAGDGVVFDTSTVSAEQIRDEDQYAGIRVNLTARLATAVIRFHVDVNVGDPVWPAPGTVSLPRLLGGEIAIRGYPLAMVLAEKIVTAFERGAANTRWRDFADIFLLSGTHRIPSDTLNEAIHRVASHRGITPRPLRDLLGGYAEPSQGKWAAWRRKQLLDAVLPENFQDVLSAVWNFTDPVLESDITGKTWHPGPQHWDESPRSR